MKSYSHLLIAFGVAVVGFVIVRYLIQRTLNRPKTLVLYHKPTGIIIEMPARYEAEAIDRMLADMKKLGGVPLNSPEFQVIKTPGK